MDVPLHGRGGAQVLGRANVTHHGRAMGMVEQRAHTVEPFRSEELFVVEPSLGFFVDGVALGRHGAELMVVGHSC